MDSLFALCYPTLTEADRACIDGLRRQHDAAFIDVVEPHFTMLFGCDAVAVDVYREHVNEVARVSKGISFSCRYAMVCNDASNDNFYAFLVPDRGFSEICRLHDLLYNDVMAPFLRLDIHYIPHIAVATDTDPRKVKDLCDDLNAIGVTLDGTIEQISICQFDGKKIRDLEAFSLQPIAEP